MQEPADDQRKRDLSQKKAGPRNLSEMAHFNAFFFPVPLTPDKS
jgi:hypothetical protein